MTIDPLLQFVPVVVPVMTLTLMIRSLKAKVKLGCWISDESGHLVLRAVCQNDAQRAVTVAAIRAPLMIWGRLPYSYSSTISKNLASFEEFFNPTFQYISDFVVDYDERAANGERTISNGQSIIASVDMERMVDTYEQSGETLCNKIVVLIFIMTFHMQVHLTNGRVIKARLGIKDRLQLLKLYWNDRRLLK